MTIPKFKAKHKINNLSVKADCNEPYISNSPCNVCGDRQSGMRYDADGFSPTEGVKEFIVCEDCAKNLD